MDHNVLRGMLAGAAGTTALNSATYLDMAMRKRPASTTPEQTLERIEEITGRASSGDDEQNRRSGLGALMGIATGVITGAAYGVARARLPRAPVSIFALGAATAANLASVLPMSALGITDPREWPPSSWASDLLPHLVYGFITAAAYESLGQSRGGGDRRHP